ncbi:hypothetical protein SLS62_000693 [Diatrype stigma]|uniref:Uncharacterized protein n=1 Tax=Diatrype stigma TaxID=117547 RepID=A0AAN9YX87_9PEZI
MKYQIATAITTFLLAGTAVSSDADRVADLIAKVAPASTTCADTSSNSECRTNVQVAPHILDSLIKYGVTSNGAVAAIVALSAFESTSYKDKVNKSSRTPGQGTANMQSYDFNVQYANSFPELKDKVAALGLPADGSASDDQKNQLLALVTDDKYNFGSAAWFLTTQCEPRYLQALGDATDAAWVDYLTTCVKTTDTDTRDALWKGAKAALGIKI